MRIKVERRNRLLWLVIAAAPGCSSISRAEFDALHRINVALAHAKRDYTVQPGDTIQVTVAKGEGIAPEYRQEVTVQPDGKVNLIDLPQPTDAQGLTIDQLQTKVKQLYEPIFKAAPTDRFNVTVQFLTSTKTAWLPDQVYITGQVRRPKAIPYRRGLTALKAVVEAEHWVFAADETRAVILRLDSEGKSVARQINLAKVALHQAEDVELFPGDVLFVPMSVIARMNLFVEFYIRGLIPINPGILRSFVAI